MKYEYFIAGRTRNKDNILSICEIFDELNISYYCFLKNDETTNSFGQNATNQEEKMKEFEQLDLKSDIVKNIFKIDMEAEKNSEKFLLVLPSGTSGHIEAGVAYGLGKKCYAIGEYDATDSLYNIFDEIYKNKDELKNALKREKEEV